MQGADGSSAFPDWTKLSILVDVSTHDTFCHRRAPLVGFVDNTQTLARAGYCTVSYSTVMCLKRVH